MAIPHTIAGRYLISILLLAVFTIQTTSVQAARSSKPKEIVVVGSKIKEVVKEAGLNINDQSIMTLSHRVVDSLYDAFRRAERNRRYLLIPQDLTYPTDASFEDEFQLLDEENLLRRLPALGFELHPDFLDALNRQANWRLRTAFERTEVNGRRMVEPYDF